MEYEDYNLHYFEDHKNFSFDLIKPIQLDGKVVDYVLNGYLRGVKGYELLGVEPRGSKFINQIHITFSKCHKGNKRKYMEMKLLEAMVEKTRFKVDVHIIHTSSSEGSITKISSCHLICNKVTREIVPSQRYDNANIGR